MNAGAVNLPFVGPVMLKIYRVPMSANGLDPQHGCFFAARLIPSCGLHEIAPAWGRRDILSIWKGTTTMTAFMTDSNRVLLEYINGALASHRYQRSWRKRFIALSQALGINADDAKQLNIEITYFNGARLILLREKRNALERRLLAPWLKL